MQLKWQAYSKDSSLETLLKQRSYCTTIVNVFLVGLGVSDVWFLEHIVNYSTNVATACSLQSSLVAYPENRACPRSVAVHMWFIPLPAAAFLAGQFKG